MVSSSFLRGKLLSKNTVILHSEKWCYGDMKSAENKSSQADFARLYPVLWLIPFCSPSAIKFPTYVPFLDKMLPCTDKNDIYRLRSSLSMAAFRRKSLASPGSVVLLQCLVQSSFHTSQSITQINRLARSTAGLIARLRAATMTSQSNVHEWGLLQQVLTGFSQKNPRIFQCYS